jgi:hypothetical protein
MCHMTSRLFSFSFSTALERRNINLGSYYLRSKLIVRKQKYRVLILKERKHRRKNYEDRRASRSQKDQASRLRLRLSMYFFNLWSMRRRTSIRHPAILVVDMCSIIRKRAIRPLHGTEGGMRASAQQNIFIIMYKKR